MESIAILSLAVCLGDSIFGDLKIILAKVNKFVMYKLKWLFIFVIVLSTYCKYAN